jgi:hypothetical protein
MAILDEMLATSPERILNLTAESDMDRPLPE